MTDYSLAYVCAWLRAHGAYQLADFIAQPPHRSVRPIRPAPACRPQSQRLTKGALASWPGVGRFCRNGSHWACGGFTGRGQQRTVCLCPVCKHPSNQPTGRGSHWTAGVLA